MSSCDYSSSKQRLVPTRGGHDLVVLHHVEELTTGVKQLAPVNCACRDETLPVAAVADTRQYRKKSCLGGRASSVLTKLLAHPTAPPGRPSESVCCHATIRRADCCERPIGATPVFLFWQFLCRRRSAGAMAARAERAARNACTVCRALWKYSWRPCKACGTGFEHVVAGRRETLLYQSENTRGDARDQQVSQCGTPALRASLRLQPSCYNVCCRALKRGPKHPGRVLFLPVTLRTRLVFDKQLAPPNRSVIPNGARTPTSRQYAASRGL